MTIEHAWAKRQELYQEAKDLHAKAEEIRKKGAHLLMSGGDKRSASEKQILDSDRLAHCRDNALASIAYAEASQVVAEGDRMCAEAHDMDAAAETLRAEGDLLWLDTLLPLYGPNAVLEYQGKEGIPVVKMTTEHTPLASKPAEEKT